jgi:hypothetical protein
LCQHITPNENRYRKAGIVLISDSKMAQLRREKNGIYHQCGRDFSRENFPENL